MDHSIVWLRAASMVFALYAAVNIGKYFMSAVRGSNKVQSVQGMIRYEGLPLPLIVNGKVLDDNLEKLGQNRFWLKNRVQEWGPYKFKEVRLCTIDHRGKLYLRFDDFAAKTN